MIQIKKGETVDFRSSLESLYLKQATDAVNRLDQNYSPKKTSKDLKMKPEESIIACNTEEGSPKKRGLIRIFSPEQ